MYARLLSILAFALVVPTMAATTNGITFNVRQENELISIIGLKFLPTCHLPSPALARSRRLKGLSSQSDGQGVSDYRWSDESWR
jgi:hypothetical protein